MQFLKTLFWVVLAVCAAAFSFRNWVVVRVQLWGDLQLYSYLPVLLLLAFLAGLLPTLIVHRATRWTLKRRLESSERALLDARTTGLAPPAADADPVVVPATGTIAPAPPADTPPA